MLLPVTTCSLVHRNLACGEICCLCLQGSGYSAEESSTFHQHVVLGSYTTVRCHNQDCRGPMNNKFCNWNTNLYSSTNTITLRLVPRTRDTEPRKCVSRMQYHHLLFVKANRHFRNRGLFEMTVGGWTTCHTQHTWDRSICIFLFNRTTLQVFVTYRTGVLYVHPLWFYRHQHDNRVRSKLFVACQRWLSTIVLMFVESQRVHYRASVRHVTKTCSVVLLHK